MRWDMGKGEVSNLKTGTATVREEDTKALVGSQRSSPRVPLQIIPKHREDLVHVRLGESVQLQGKMGTLMRKSIVMKGV